MILDLNGKLNKMKKIQKIIIKKNQNHNSNLIQSMNQNKTNQQFIFLKVEKTIQNTIKNCLNNSIQ